MEENVIADLLEYFSRYTHGAFRTLVSSYRTQALLPRIARRKM